MTRRLSILLLFAATSLAAHAAEPAGRWRGGIELPGGELAITVELAPAGDGAWAGTIDIPAQGVRGFELSRLTVEGGRVRFEMAGIPGRPTFDGRLSEAGDSIAGTFRQSSQRFPFSLRRVGETAATTRASAATAAAADPGPDAPAAADSADSPGEPPQPGQATATAVAGEWLGVLDVGPTKLRLALSIEESGDGALGATLDSIDQGAKIPVDTVYFEGGRLRLTITAIGGSYEGTLSADGHTLEGVWSQGGRELPLAFERQQEAFELRRPQHPEGPFPYQSHEVTFRSAAGDVLLAGTLLVPPGEGPFPAVAMVTGSGPQDRDETIVGHKPFLVIADALARRGIASLRWDDRGVGESGGDHLGSTVEDFAADARAAVALLAARPEVAPKGIGILGHSEGGLIGPMVAAADEAVAFLVLLAPPGEPLPALLARQTRDILALQGVGPELLDRVLAGQAEDLALVADRSVPSDRLQERLRALAAERREQLTPEERALLQFDEATVEQSIAMATSAWFRSLMRQDPATYLREVKVPVLALFGDKDLQVDARVNAAALRAALEAGAAPPPEVRILPGLNHLFQHAETGGIEEYGTLEETFAPQALELIGDWIEALTAARSGDA